MVTYIYFVKCPNCEDEPFDFFEDAKAFALGCLSQNPVITQVEVDRNDFGECTDSCDQGIQWSWEDEVGEPEEETITFSKDDIKSDYDPDNDPEFQDDDFFAINSEDSSSDISVKGDSDNFDTTEPVNEWVDSTGARVTVNGKSIATAPQATKATPTRLDQLAPTLDMYTTNVTLVFDNKKVKIPFSKEKMAYGDSFVYKDIFTRATGSVLKEIANKTGVKLNRDYGNNMIIWTYNNDNNIILVHIPGFNFIIDKNDLIAQLGGQTSVGSTNTRQNVTSALKALNNSDFQNRNGNYPLSGIPDTIYASDTDISFSFKNTNQSAAERWVRNYLSQNGFTVAPENVKSYQSGDYDDDWVEVSVNIKNISFTSNESCSRKPIPEGMTIEQLVETMEENEDTVECTNCGGLFEKAICTHNKEGFGWRCPSCSQDSSEVRDLGTTYDGGYPKPFTWVCEFDGHEIGTVEASTEEEAYNKMEQAYPEYHYGEYDGVAIVYPEDDIEDITENYQNNDEVEIYYPKLTAEVEDNNGYSHSYTSDYSYSADKQTVVEKLWDLITDEDVPLDKYPEGKDTLYNDEAAWKTYIEENLDNLIEKYGTQLQDYFYDQAVEKFEEEIYENFDDYFGPDPDEAYDSWRDSQYDF